jgi:hypothetical protein
MLRWRRVGFVVEDRDECGPTAKRQPPRARCTGQLQKSTILRAKRSAARGVGRRVCLGACLLCQVLFKLLYRCLGC